MVREFRTLLLRSSILGGFAMMLPAVCLAQATASEEGAEPEAADTLIEVVDEDAEDAESIQDKITVTGSRIQRDTFSSIAPLQVIGTTISREAGLLNPADILQASTAASGQQIDETFSGFVLDNGPGATTVDLRGLGANRTLVLLNGRRISPAGVEGAPSSPDLGLLPSSLIDRYEILLDGASSIYGSDAVAGVTNAILRKDFDGLELEAFVEVPERSNGEEYTLSAAYGYNMDRGFFGFGAEYSRNERVKFADRIWTAGCDKHHEITTDGEIRSVDIATPQSFLQTWGLAVEANECKSGAATGLVTSVGDKNFTTYWTPGVTNTGIPNISDSIVASTPVDLDGDGIIDIDVLDYTTAEINTQISDLFPEFENYSLMSYGEYTLPGEANITPYYEALYAVRKTNIEGGLTNLAPTVPADNPYNPCNPNGINGVDCGLAPQELLENSAYRATFATGNFPTCAQFGFTLEECTPELFGFLPAAAIGPDAVRPFFSLANDRTDTKVDLAQSRIVGGIRGDMPFLDIGPLSGWSFDVWGSYSQSIGTTERPGVRYTDRLLFSLETSVLNEDGSVTCGDETLVGEDLTGDGVISAVNDCVPVNLFTDAVLGQRLGQLSAEEADFVYDVRDFKTTYTQKIINGVATGTLFDLPAGPLQAVVGFEFRSDKIKSLADDIAQGGVFQNFFSDPGTTAKKEIKEYFGELALPIVANQPFFREMNLELAGRITDDEIYGTNDTYNAKFGWRPHDALLLRGTYGTSFRAPSLSENFLGAQTGFVTIGDPCVVPEGATMSNLDGSESYNADLDPRENAVLENCVREGVDPTMLGLDENGGRYTDGIYGIEATRGGSLELDPETSTSYSYGFSFEQPWFDSFDLAVSLTYYNIEIEDSIIRPSSGFIVSDCYTRDDGVRSLFCDRITRGNNASAAIDSENLITFVGNEFINRDEERASGYDLNIAFNKDLTVFGEPVDLSVDLRANKLEKRTTLLIDDDGNEDFRTFREYWGFPNWSVVNRVNLEYKDYRFNWRTDYQSAVEQNPIFVDEFGSDATGGLGDTCIGVDNGGVDCRDLAEADPYFLHSASLYYNGDTWTLGAGIRNVFDQQPPIVDSSEVTAFNNTPLGYGYDLQGRTFFVNVGKRF